MISGDILTPEHTYMYIVLYIIVFAKLMGYF